MKHKFCVGHVRPQNVDPRLQPMYQAPIHVCDENYQRRGNCVAIVYSGENGMASDEESVILFAQKIADLLSGRSSL